MNTDIKFGTDGWRGVIADDFTYSNLGIVSLRTARYAKKKRGGICIGYDNRFLSPEYASYAAAVIENEGVKVDLSLKAVPSPCVSHRVKNTSSVLGVVITASHNSYEYNGFKIKEKYGGSAGQQVSSEITQGLKYTSPTPGKIEFRGRKNDWSGDYINEMLNVLPSGKASVVCDFMHGTGSPYFEKILYKKGYKLLPLNDLRDPLFGGRGPEPKPDYLTELKDTVIKNKADIGFAFDGDADRIAVIDEKGRYLSPQIILAVLADDILSRGKKGKIITTVAGTYLAGAIADSYGVDAEIVPIGFKNICPYLIEGNVAVAGEESGGIGFGDYLPERDAIYTACRLIEMTQRKGKKIGEIWDNLKSRYGNSVYLREDIKINPGMDKNKLLGKLKKNVKKKSFPFKVARVLALDGLRIIIENNSWLLIRPSGTEPVVRIYAEAEGGKKARMLLNEGVSACKRFLE